MPKQRGPYKIEGFFDGKIYYKMGKDWYFRNSSAPSAEKIKKDPAFKSFRNYSKEFGAASSVGSSFKKSFGLILDNMSDNNLTKRISGLFTKLIHNGRGRKGKRSVEILPNKELFRNFQFKEEHNFDYIFKSSYKLEVKEGRKEIILSVPSFRPSKRAFEIAGATHFRLILHVVTFSDHMFAAAAKSYLPAESVINKISVTEYSDLILMENKINAITLKAKLNIKQTLPTSVGVVTCVGIEFYQMAGDEAYVLSSKSCMKIAEVF